MSYVYQEATRPLLPRAAKTYPARMGCLPADITALFPSIAA